MEIEQREVAIECADGFKLAGTMFVPAGDVRGAVMLAPATGIKRQFYTAFARHLAFAELVLLTYDNRGIGESVGVYAGAEIPSLTNWGKLDMTAVLGYLQEEYPELDCHLLGHSAGGQLVGLMENALELKSMFAVASSSGSVQYAEFPFSLKSRFYLNIFIPLSNWLFGHTKSQWMGMGEPLPKEVGREWRRWCNGKGYVKVDLDSKIRQHHYDDLDFNTMWVYAEDDDIANSRSVQDMVRVYTKINAEVVEISPGDYGYEDIGHMKFFSSKRSRLWPLATDWLLADS